MRCRRWESLVHRTDPRTPANIGLEPSRRLSRAMIPRRRAAQAARYADSWSHSSGGALLGYAGFVSPTVLRVKGFRFYFFSREERRAHVHVQHANGEAKFWIDPAVELAANFSLKPKQVTEVQTLIEEHLNEIRGAWAKHFPSGSH